ncbi:hypothetical protein WCE41_03620 [Luteimonas sp. MJ246]
MTLDAMTDTRAAHEAVTRLFDLSRSGEVDNVEFNQLDSLVYARLIQAYECDQAGIGAGGESIS